MGIKDPIARTKSGFQTYALSPAFDWLVTFNKHWFDWMIASSNQHQFQNPSKRVGSDKFKIQVTCFVIGFPILVAFPMLMFYDIICGICMPNSDTILESHILDIFKIFLFLVVYLIPSICSSWALLVTRTGFQSWHYGKHHSPDFLARTWDEKLFTEAVYIYQFTNGEQVFWPTSRTMYTDTIRLTQSVLHFAGSQITLLIYHSHLFPRKSLWINFPGLKVPRR